MMTIMLYGFLGKQYGKVHHYDVKNASEAVRALSATIKGFKKAFIDGGWYKILRGGKEALSLEETIEPQSQRETIRIIPVVQGRGDLGKIVLGAALMIFAPQLAPMLSGLGVTQAAIVSFGFSMVLGGIAGLLFSPEITSQQSVERPENKPSYSFDGPINTVAQGNPVPICYGKLLVGSQVISAGLSVEQI